MSPWFTYLCSSLPSFWLTQHLVTGCKKGDPDNALQLFKEAGPSFKLILTESSVYITQLTVEQGPGLHLQKDNPLLIFPCGEFLYQWWFPIPALHQNCLGSCKVPSKPGCVPNQTNFVSMWGPDSSSLQSSPGDMTAYPLRLFTPSHLRPWSGKEALSMRRPALAGWGPRPSAGLGCCYPLTVKH